MSSARGAVCACPALAAWAARNRAWRRAADGLPGIPGGDFGYLYR